MGKNILIVPSNAVSRTPDRTPYIDFVNNAGNTPIDIKVLTNDKNGIFWKNLFKLNII